MQKAWERPPKYTEEDDCMEAIYMELTASGNLIRVVDMINDGTPLDQIAHYNSEQSIMRMVDKTKILNQL